MLRRKYVTLKAVELYIRGPDPAVHARADPRGGVWQVCMERPPNVRLSAATRWCATCAWRSSNRGNAPCAVSLLCPMRSAIGCQRLDEHSVGCQSLAGLRLESAAGEGSSSTGLSTSI
jgi:hypothetical protein